ncbi:GNAT family N-acetyltransferase [Streptomyces sp. NPDC090306]|uniref:GNAT family N-acetyltransferase n=1 Tax=unclassified Streptomyces TaxID=2593676 RepID=UPI0036E2B176
MSLRDRSTPPLPHLYGHGLHLSVWDAGSDADAAAWLRGITDPEFTRWNTPLTEVTDIEGARRTLASRARAVLEGRTVPFRVADAADGRILGHIGLNEIDTAIRVARVGYWVMPEARGRGVATHALALTAAWALGDLGLHRLELGHALGHGASCHIAERCGFRAEGTLRGAMFEEGRRDAFRDAHLHARLATDPEPDLGPRP